MFGLDDTWLAAQEEAERLRIQNTVLRTQLREVLLILRGESPAAARLADSYADTCGIDLDGPVAYRNRGAREG